VLGGVPIIKLAYIIPKLAEVARELRIWALKTHAGSREAPSLLALKQKTAI